MMTTTWKKKHCILFVCINKTSYQTLGAGQNYSPTNAQCMETATVTQSQLWESENCADSF